LTYKFRVCYKDIVKDKMLTTKEAQKALQQRGVAVAYSTIAYWVRSGKFDGAIQEETPRGVVWYIPQKTIDNFEQPAQGRPAKPKE
jgi:hypothetical protein